MKKPVKKIKPNQPQTKSEFNLFNPYKTFNYFIMPKSLDISSLNNPYVQVVWEDTPDNITQERIKSVKQYFQKKYSTTNVNVITKVKTTDDVAQTVDVSVNVMDNNYQFDLIKSYLESKGLAEHNDDVLSIDSKVQNKMILLNAEITPFKKWYIKRIEFSNFLSYGENQVLDFTRCNGITVIESDPPNFGGKTVLTVDLLMFLFFNETTKTSKAEEVFNRFTDKDVVSVRGEVEIDGEDYIIARQIERKKTKSGDWNVKTELDFFKKLPDGTLQNFTGEQRRETEKFIKTSIGEKEDFLITILTTATNLEDLLDSKPTARGQVLSKFLGLEFLKKKEEIAKELLSEFSRGMVSNVYNSEELKQNNEGFEEQITHYNELNAKSELELEDLKKRILTGQNFRDDLIQKKHFDIDSEIAILNPEKLKEEINTLELKELELREELKKIKVVEPSSYYHENQHDKIKEEHKEAYKVNVKLSNKIDEINKLKASVSEGIKCEHCGIELMNAAITQSKIAELDELQKELEISDTLIKKLIQQESDYIQLKKEFDEYEKNKLIKEKTEINIESTQLKKASAEDKLKRYFDVQSKIEENKKIDEQIMKASIKLDNLTQEQSKIEKQITQGNFQITNLREKIQKNLELIEKIKQEFEEERKYKIYLDVYGKNGIGKIIMKTMMPVINNELQRLLQDSCYFNLEIRINDKNEVEFIMIDNSTGIEKLMTSGSGFERTIASMALRAVLSKVCSLPKPNIIVWDEVFGKISNDNLELVGEFFNKIKEYFDKIFIISHNPLINNWGNTIIKITKRDNVSEITS